MRSGFSPMGRKMNPRIRWFILLSMGSILLTAILLGSRINATQKNTGYLVVKPEETKLLLYDQGVEIKGVEKNGITLFALPSFVTVSGIDQGKSETKIYTENGGLLEDPAINTVQKVGIGSEEAQTPWKVAFCKADNLHTLFLDTYGKSVNDIERGLYSDISLSEYNEEGEVLCSFQDTKIKGRGNRTWENTEKHSFEIKLPVEYSLDGMKAGKKWVLLANPFDPTKMKNKIIFDAAEEMGMNYPIESDWIDLYFNGEYWGNYLLCKEPHIGNDGVDISNLEIENTSFYNPADYYKDDRIKGFEYDTGNMDITGGYLVELVPESQYEKKKCGFVVNNNRFLLKSPDNASLNEVKYIASFFNKVDSEIKGFEDLSNIDIGSFADCFLLNEISLNMDTDIASCFYYKDAGADTLYAGPGWDYDGAFASTQAEDLADPTLNILDMTRPSKLEWNGCLMKNSEYFDHLTSEFGRCIPVFNRILNNRIDEYYDRISASVKMDRIRWNGEKEDTENGYYSNTDSEIRFLKFFLYNRLKYLAEYYQVEAEVDDPEISDNTSHKIVFKYDDGITETMIVKDGTRLSEKDLPEYDRSKYYGWAYHCDVSYNVPVYEDMTLTLREI